MADYALTVDLAENDAIGDACQKASVIRRSTLVPTVELEEGGQNINFPRRIRHDGLNGAST